MTDDKRRDSDEITKKFCKARDCVNYDICHFCLKCMRHCVCDI